MRNWTASPASSAGWSDRAAAMAILRAEMERDLRSRQDGSDEGVKSGKQQWGAQCHTTDWSTCKHEKLGKRTVRIPTSLCSASGDSSGAPYRLRVTPLPTISCRLELHRSRIFPCLQTLLSIGYKRADRSRRVTHAKTKPRWEEPGLKAADFQEFLVLDLQCIRNATAVPVRWRSAKARSPSL
jgi:hypothetical protein